MNRLLVLILLVVVVLPETAHAFAPPVAKTSRTVPSLGVFASSSHLDKDRYEPSKVKNDKYDVIVIGSGIGGLSAASLLAQNNKKVLVLEQHYVAGGCCHTFTKKGYKFGTGIHYVGELGDGGFAKQLCDSLTAPNDPVIWDKLNKNYEMAVIGDHHYPILAGEEAMKHALVAKFSEERDAIYKYYELLNKASNAFDRAFMLKSLPLPLVRFMTTLGLDRLVDAGFHKYSQRTVKEVLSELTDNDDLKAVLAYNWADYGVEPSRAPFVLHALVAKSFLDGAFYPHEGPSSIVRKIIRQINDCGGSVLVSAPVQKVLVDDKAKRVKGVQMADGQVIEAPVVCSDAGIVQTAKQLLPPGLIDIDLSSDHDVVFDGKLHSAASGLQLFVGLKGTPRELNIPSCQYWIHPTSDLDWQVDWEKSLTRKEALNLKPEEIGPILVTFPCTKDKAWKYNSPHKITVEVITVSPWNWFQEFQGVFDKKTNSHGETYEAAKNTFAKKIWSRVAEVVNQSGAKLPLTLDELDFYDLGTPLTFAHYLGADAGSLNGLDHDRVRFNSKNFLVRLRPEIPELPGLFLTGQDASTLGFVGAMAGGMLCAQKVLGVANPTFLLRNTSLKQGKAIKVASSLDTTNHTTFLGAV